MVKYRLTRLAQYDLEEIWKYTVKEWSHNQAEKYTSGLLSCFDMIVDGRTKGIPIDSIRQGYKKVLFGKHFIFFRNSHDNVVEIIRVLHSSMDIERHF